MFFIDFEPFLNVEGDIVVWSHPGSFNLHLVRSGRIQLAGAGVNLPQSGLGEGGG